MRKTNEKWKVFNEILFWLSIEGFLLYGVAMELIEYPGLLFTYPYLFLMLLAGVRICMQGNDWKEWLFILSMCVIALLSYRSTGDRTVLAISLLICCVKDIRLERLLKLDLGVRIGTAMLYIFLPFTGAIANPVNEIIGGRPRTFFGWFHPNGMGKSLMMICMEWAYVRHGHFRWYDYAGMTGLVVFLDLTANSRTAELLILGMLFLEAVSEIWKRKKRDIYVIWSGLTASALIGAMLLPAFAVTFFKRLADGILERTGTVGSRLYLTWEFVQNHGITLFGSAYTPGSGEYLDMLFANVVFLRGLAFGLIIIVLSILAVRYAYRERDERYLLLLFVFFAYGMMESEHLNPIYAFFPVLLGIPVFNQRYGKKMQETEEG